MDNATLLQELIELRKRARWLEGSLGGYIRATRAGEKLVDPNEEQVANISKAMLATHRQLNRILAGVLAAKESGSKK